MDHPTLWKEFGQRRFHFWMRGSLTGMWFCCRLIGVKGGSMVKPVLTEIFISEDDSVLAFGSDRYLYWNGERLATSIKLTTQQGIGAWVVILSAALGGVFALLQIITWFKA
jgi:hypothetical protein